MSKKSRKKKKRKDTKGGPAKARPEEKPSAAKTVAQMVKDGDVQADPKAKVDTTLYDFEGNPIERGMPEGSSIIGPDDTPEFSYRPDDAYPEVPPAVKQAEHRYVLPLAKFIADSIGITVIDDYAYNRILTALQSRSLFVVLNLYKTKVRDGVASWFGLVLQCRRHPVVLVEFREHLSTERIGISQVRCWSSKEQKYYIFGERDKFMAREVAGATILNYLQREGILPNI